MGGVEGELVSNGHRELSISWSRALSCARIPAGQRSDESSRELAAPMFAGTGASVTKRTGPQQDRKPASSAQLLAFFTVKIAQSTSSRLMEGKTSGAEHILKGDEVLSASFGKFEEGHRSQADAFFLNTRFADADC